MDTFQEGKTNKGQMRPDERWGAVVSHLSTILPLYSLIANGLLYFTYRESSRVVCLHARQSINLQLLFLAAFTAKLLLDMFASVLSAVVRHEALAEYVDQGGTYVLAVIILFCAGLGLVGAWKAMQGKIFIYPVAGKALYQNYIQARRNEW